MLHHHISIEKSFISFVPLPNFNLHARNWGTSSTCPTLINIRCDIATQTPCKGDHIPGYLNNLILTLPQLVLHVNAAGGNGCTKPWPLCVFHSLPCNRNILPNAPTHQFNSLHLNAIFKYNQILI